MEEPEVRRAVDAAISTASALGLQVDEVAVIHNSDRIALRLIPCDVLTRVAPSAHQAGSEFDAALRQTDLVAPHFTDRIASAQREVGDRQRTPELPGADREFLSSTLSTLSSSVSRGGAREQLLHGEPHPGNLLSTRKGPLFVDLGTCCRGPVEFDVAHAREEVGAHYPGVDHDLIHQCRTLGWALFTTWRWLRDDQLPDGHYWRVEGLNLVRAALERCGLDRA